MDQNTQPAQSGRFDQAFGVRQTKLISRSMLVKASSITPTALQHQSNLIANRPMTPSIDIHQRLVSPQYEAQRVAKPLPSMIDAFAVAGSASARLHRGTRQPAGTRRRPARLLPSSETKDTAKVGEVISLLAVLSYALLHQPWQEGLATSAFSQGVRLVQGLQSPAG